MAKELDLRCALNVHDEQIGTIAEDKKTGRKVMRKTCSRCDLVEERTKPLKNQPWGKWVRKHNP